MTTGRRFCKCRPWSGFWEVERALSARLVLEATAPIGRQHSRDVLRALGEDGHVIRRIESFSLEPVHQHGDRPIVFGARDAARLVLAADEAALAVARVAIGVV